MTDVQTAQFTITRVFDAPRDEVWHAWTDPDEMSAWLHPRGLTTQRETVELDLRVGGHYQFAMVTPDGARYPTGGVYREIVEPERLVFTWGRPEDADDTAPVATVTLAEVGDGTEMTFHLVGIPGEAGDGDVFDGWQSSFDVLTDHVA